VRIYLRSRPLTGWTNLEANVRGTDAAWTLPELDADGPLLSLGSLGAADTALMQSLIDSLSGAAVRVIVSMGPQHDERQLAGNMTGAEFLPQTSILPLVDVVITHGGNNTVTESLYFGNARLAAVSLRLQAAPGTSVAAAALERATT
jgi:UDP:flavonoid glycosyltransferase YjiC (YdhE family)